MKKRSTGLSNHYWVVAGSTTEVYSSAAGDYVPVTDPTYVAWLDNGTYVPLPVPTQAEWEAGQALADYLLPTDPPRDPNVEFTFEDWLLTQDATDSYARWQEVNQRKEDANYREWQDGANAPSPVDSEIELGRIMAQLDLTPIPAAILDAFKDSLSDKLPVRLLFEVFYSHENRIRTLEGLGNITKAQFKTALKNLL